MIEQMTLRDLGVIAEARLPIGPGFTAITGETGAGKTMVVTGLGLLLGQRADSQTVRAGAAQATVDGIWVVPEHGDVADRVQDAGGQLEPLGDGRAELYLGRILSAEGRSRATVGGRTAPAAVLADLADHLVVVHGQSDQLRLRSAAAQREGLDRFGGQAVADALHAYQDRYATWRRLDQERAQLVADREDRAAEAERLRMELAEIERVDPQPGEDLQLAAREQRLANVEDLRLAAATARAALSDDDAERDVAALLAQARQTLEHAAASDPELTAFADAAADLGYRVADLSTGLAGYLADLDESGPAELAAVQERRAQVSALVRTHGDLDAALALADTGAARLAELDDDDDRLQRMAGALEDAAAALEGAAAALTAAREDAAARLGAAVTNELHSLALPDATLQVAVSPAPASTTGRDEVTLLLAPHPGASLRPVARSASGGELSRVMLAIEVVIAGTDPVPTFVFDEVDAGIGGAAAIEVGRRLARLAESSQVIAVTHLAQVAAFATTHLSVVKASDGTVTSSSVQSLSGAEREAEMARLLSGMADSDAALTHARELIRVAQS